MKHTIRSTACAAVVTTTCALLSACGTSAPNIAHFGPGDHARPAVKTTCPQPTVLGGLPAGVGLQDRTLHPFSASVNGVRTIYANVDQSLRVEVISGGFVDDISEEYDDLERTRNVPMRGVSATVYAGSSGDAPVTAAVWRENGVTAPCDVHAIVAVGLVTGAGHYLVGGGAMTATWPRWRRWWPLALVLVVLVAGAGIWAGASWFNGHAKAANTPASALPRVKVTPTDPVIAAAGDIACSQKAVAHLTATEQTHRCSEALTADVMAGHKLAAVLPLGDLQYECADTANFAASYAQTWGRFKAISRPAIGNHEYGRICKRDDATPYFTYFGAAAGPVNKGWYSYDIGSWHLIALNSECTYGKGAAAVGGCQAGSEQETWLRSDLAAHPASCTLVYWHEPRFSSGEHGDAQQMATIWNELVAAHVDVVLSGHNHDYERFSPAGAAPRVQQVRGANHAFLPNYQAPTLDPTGIREFVVGTGGKNHYAFNQPAMNGEVVRNGDAFGVLLLTLHQGGYTWQFVSAKGSTFADSGSGTCH